MDGGFQTLGLHARGQGRDAAVAALSDWDDEWKGWRLVPIAMVEVGDRLITLGRFQARGCASGVELDREFAQVITIRSGMVWRERDFMDWNDGLRFAGLEPAHFEQHLRGREAERPARRPPAEPERS